MQFEGRVKEVMPVQSGVSQRTGEPWSNQEFVFGFYETSDAIYEKEIVLKLRNDKIKQYNLQVGDKIKAKFSLGINNYQGRKYNEIFTGDIEILQRAQPTQPAPAPQGIRLPHHHQEPAPAPQGEQQEQPTPGVGNDLPF
jgi:hypothetical protein